MTFSGLIGAACLVAAVAAQAAPADNDVDLRYYPPRPEQVDKSKLPSLVQGLTSGTPFLKARRRILALGWKPVDRMDTSIEETPDCALLECQLHRRRVAEVDACAMDRSVCTFYYRKGKHWLQLMAIGESLNELTVYYWADVPPQPKGQ
jgi:hypothetical protein